MAGFKLSVDDFLNKLSFSAFPSAWVTLLAENTRRRGLESTSKVEEAAWDSPIITPVAGACGWFAQVPEPRGEPLLRMGQVRRNLPLLLALDFRV